MHAPGTLPVNQGLAADAKVGRNRNSTPQRERPDENRPIWLLSLSAAAPALQLMTPQHSTQHTARPRASSQSTHAWSRRSTPKLSSRKPASSSTAQHSAAQRTLVAASLRFTPTAASPHARLAGTCPSSPSVWDRKRSRPLHAQTSPFDPSCPLCETEQNKVPLNCGAAAVADEEASNESACRPRFGQRWSATLRDWACRSPAPAQRWRARAKNPSHPRSRDFVRNIGECNRQTDSDR